MGMAVEPGAEAVEEGDGAEPGAGGRRRGVLRAAEALKTEQRLNLMEKNPRHRRDGLARARAEPTPCDVSRQATSHKLTTRKSSLSADMELIILVTSRIVRAALVHH